MHNKASCSAKECQASLPVSTPNLRVHRNGRQRPENRVEDGRYRIGGISEKMMRVVLTSGNDTTTSVPTAGTGQLYGAVGGDRP